MHHDRLLRERGETADEVVHGFVAAALLDQSNS